jgi:hypothetical protein
MSLCHITPLLAFLDIIREVTTQLTPDIRIFSAQNGYFKRKALILLPGMMVGRSNLSSVSTVFYIFHAELISF